MRADAFAALLQYPGGFGDVRDDRALVAAVFVNRLRKGMLLQTDPTVIYGLGETFDDNLRKRDLLADTPWNTYSRRGLPPTPIATVTTALTVLSAVHQGWRGISVPSRRSLRSRMVTSGKLISPAKNMVWNEE